MLPNGISEQQYQFLKHRMGCASDAQALRLAGLSRESLRGWRRQPIFRQLHETCRNDQLNAFRVLALSFGELALDSLEFLLRSPKGSDRKAGLEAWRHIFRVGQVEKDDSEGLPQQIFNILNLRGDVDPRVLQMANPMQLPAPKVRAEEVSE